VKADLALSAEAVKTAIAQGVSSGLLAYVGKARDGGYEPFLFGQAISAGDVEISEDVFIITRETADAYKQSKAAPVVPPEPPVINPPAPPAGGITYPEVGGGGGHVVAEPPPGPAVQPPVGLPADVPVTRLTWAGEVPAQKWMNFYTKVLSKFATGSGLRLIVRVEVAQEAGITPQKIEETRQGLRELGLNDQLQSGN